MDLSFRLCGSTLAFGRGVTAVVWGFVAECGRALRDAHTSRVMFGAPGCPIVVAENPTFKSPGYDLPGDHPLTVDKLMIAALNGAGSLKELPLRNTFVNAPIA